MYPVKIIFQYIYYKLFSKLPKAYGIYPPFIFQLLTHLKKPVTDKSKINEIENLRKTLKKSKKIIKIQDSGQGSKK